MNQAILSLSSSWGNPTHPKDDRNESACSAVREGTLLPFADNRESDLVHSLKVFGGGSLPFHAGCDGKGDSRQGGDNHNDHQQFHQGESGGLLNVGFSLHKAQRRSRNHGGNYPPLERFVSQGGNKAAPPPSTIFRRRAEVTSDRTATAFRRGEGVSCRPHGWCRGIYSWQTRRGFHRQAVEENVKIADVRLTQSVAHGGASNRSVSASSAWRRS